jgi:hypothetical protein
MNSTLSPYDQVISRKRKWTPVAVQKGNLVDGSQETIYRALGLRHLELPVREFLQQGLEKELSNLRTEYQNSLVKSMDSLSTLDLQLFSWQCALLTSNPVMKL